MECILALYALPYDPAYPVVCYDERPCCLLGEPIALLPMRPGRVAKQDYSYTRHGTCNLLAAIEPLTGRRIGRVTERRTRVEYTQMCQQIAAAYPDAVKIRLVQDNLNTHDVAAFYHCLAADEAFALAQRFEFHYTPKHASWLNMIECEFAVLSRQCLKQRIPTIERVRDEVLTLMAEREAAGITINWQFSIQTARTTFNRHYTAVHPGNQKYKET